MQIDRRLIKHIATNASSQDVVGTIQEMCMKLGIETSAERVESSEQLEALLELNFTTFQGYFFSKPITAKECGEFIRAFPEMTYQL